MICATFAVNAQTKKIFVDTHVSGTTMTFSLFKKQTDSSYLVIKKGTSTYQYTFDSLSAGIYRVYVNIPYTKYLPTWHPLKALWQDAADINLTTADSFACTQGLIANPAMLGNYSLSGTLTEGVLKTAGDPLKSINVVLLNGSNQFVTMSSSNDTGKFYFTNLPAGTYKIRTDIVNTIDPNPKSVVLDSAHTSSTVKITVNKGGATFTGVQTVMNISAPKELHVYPNPSVSYFTINYSETAPYSIYNMKGQLVLKGELNDKNATVETYPLSKGIYFIRVDDQVKKIIIQ